MTILFEEIRFLLTERWKNEGKIKMEAYAVLATGGKQVLVKVGDTVEIEKIEAEEGKEVALDTVCAVSDGTTLKIGTPYVEGAKVTLTVVGVKRGVKTINFKAKRRKGYRRTVGHRQQYTVATVTAIA
jgi:large subunit ribosomal protein L21